MKKVMLVIVLVFMVGVAIGYIANRGVNKINDKTGVMYKLKENLCIKKRIMIKEYTKDICVYREYFRNDNMFAYSLFKAKKLMDKKFGLEI